MSAQSWRTQPAHMASCAWLNMSYNRMCSLTTECVLLRENAFSSSGTPSEGMRKCQKRPIYIAKEACLYDKRGLYLRRAAGGSSARSCLRRKHTCCLRRQTSTSCPRPTARPWSRSCTCWRRRRMSTSCPGRSALRCPALTRASPCWKV